MHTNKENQNRAFYFGLPVEVIHRMETCSLVRFSGQDLIVDTDDLALVERMELGLTGCRLSERLCPESVHFLHAGVATTR